MSMVRRKTHLNNARANWHLHYLKESLEPEETPITVRRDLTVELNKRGIAEIPTKGECSQEAQTRSRNGGNLE